MKKGIILTFLLLIIGVFSVESQRQIWTVGTANTLTKKSVRISIFQPSAYGLSNTLELSSQVIAFPIVPNIYLKKKWIEKKKWALSSKHGFLYPTWFLNSSMAPKLLQNIPNGTKAPNIISFKNELLISYGFGESLCPSYTREEFSRVNRFLGPKTILTFKLGLQNGFSSDDHNFPIITDKFLFHHTYNYFDKLMFYTGVDIDGQWYKDLDYSADVDLIVLSDSYWSVEHKGLVKWETGRKFFNLVIGYQASYGSYPSGNRFFIGPFIDLMWILRRDKLEYGLFGKKMF